jgi:hypothetical protein
MPNVTALIHQLQLPHLSARQQSEILAELLAATIHLNTHCGDDFQARIASEMEKLPDDDENESANPVKLIHDLLTASDSSAKTQLIEASPDAWHIPHFSQTEFKT